MEKKHTIPPHKIDHRANVFALAEVGATDVLSVSAVGLTGKKPFSVGQFVLVEDLFRIMDTPTFIEDFKGGIVHPDMSAPYSPGLKSKVLQAGKASGLKIKTGAVLADTKGPRYETAAEVAFFRKIGVHLLGMTSTVEAILFNELRATGVKIQNATLAITTNFGTGVLKKPLDHNEVKVVVAQRENEVKNIVSNLIALV